MIYIPRRKIVVFMLFTLIFTLSALLLHRESENVFSGAVTGKIIVDAGHGLPDGGAVGATGTIESTLNIKIAKLLQKELQKNGYTVIMTRSDENTITEDGKTIASRKRAICMRG